MAKDRGLSFYRRKKRISVEIVRDVFTWIFGIFTSIFIAVVMTYFFGMQTVAVGESMEPAVYAGQTVLVDRFTYVISSPKIGDVIAFLPNGNQNSHYYVKRIVAVPGDKLIVRDGVLYVNGIESAWVKEPLEFPGITQNELVLKTGEFFCLGDNADESEDSRSANIGPVNESDIIGKVWFRAGCKKAGMGFVK